MDDDEKMPPEIFAEWVKSCPEPTEEGGDVDEDAYSEASRYMAKHMLSVLESNFDKPDDMNAVYDEAKKQGMKNVRPSGFMVGWAFNAARTIVGRSPAPNPAIVELPTL